MKIYNKESKKMFLFQSTKVTKESFFIKPTNINKLTIDLVTNQNQAFRFYGNSKKKQ